MMRKAFLLTLLFFSWFTGLSAQTLNQAKTWYLQGKFDKALPVFKNQIALRPRDASVNLWYGACLVETASEENALPYLQFAAGKSIPDAELYLSRYWLMRAVPDSAMVHIEHYLSRPRLENAKKDAALAIKADIESTLVNLQKVEDVCFIDSVVVLKANLYNTLKLSPDAGSLVPARPLFPESKSNGAAYLPQKNDRAFYGNLTTDKGLDIVARHRLLDKWDDEEPLSDVINSASDEINPWFLADGTTLYFASRRPGGMGGYDLYVTRLNKSGAYLLPDHLNMPFNSRDNDYFLIIDEFSNRGYLATDRNQPKGYACIYTFIPNPTVVFVKDKTPAELRSLAEIRSIQDTWKGRNIDSLRVQNFTTTPRATGSRPEMVFVLNDELQCRGEADFQSDDARNLYRTYVEKNERLGTGNAALDGLRKNYETATEDQKQTVANSIITLENEMLELKKTLPELEMKIRNLELTKRLK